MNKALLDKTGLPFAIIATPFAPVERDEAPIPTVSRCLCLLFSCFLVSFEDSQGIIRLTGTCVNISKP